MRLIRIGCLAGLLMPVAVNAQVVNGNFEAGPSGWEWKRGATEWPDQDCFASLATYNVSNSGDTPSIGTAPASGRVADLDHGFANSVRWYVCKQIQQTVTIPANTQLSFDAKIGSVNYEFGQQFAPTKLDVEILENNVVLASMQLEGQTVDDPCPAGICPQYATYTLDVAPYWNRPVTLRLRTLSEQEDVTTSHDLSPSTANVDNVTFASAPAPVAPIFGVPSVSGNNHSVSWSYSEHSSQYVLEQRIDAGAWTQVYVGLNRGWTTMNASSGTYRYQVKACGNGCSAWSSETSVVVPQDAPDSLTANVVGRSFEIIWGVSQGANRYVLEQKGQDGLWVTAYDGPATQSTLYNLAPDIYGFRVKACGGVCSGYSAETYVTAVDTTPVILRYLSN